MPFKTYVCDGWIPSKYGAYPPLFSHLMFHAVFWYSEYIYFTQDSGYHKSNIIAKIEIRNFKFSSLLLVLLTTSPIMVHKA